MKSLPQPTKSGRGQTKRKNGKNMKTNDNWEGRAYGYEPKNRNFAYTDDGTGLRSEREIVYYFWLWNYK